MPLDPQVKLILEEEKKLGIQPYNMLTPLEAREQMLKLAPSVDPEFSVKRVEDLQISGPNADIPIRLYYPEGKAPYPVVVYFHGGGWVIGNLDTHDAICHALAKSSNCLIAAIDYRLAPEHPYPAAIKDAYTASKWVYNNANIIQADHHRMALMGESAGATLATVACMMAGEKGDFSVRLQILIYPVTNYNFNTSSYQQNGTGYSVTRELMMWFWKNYLGNETNPHHRYISPLRSKNIGNLPKALILTAEYDPLRDEGELYGKNMKDAGTNVKLLRYDGMIHGFFRMTTKLNKAKEALTVVADEIKSNFFC